jgi:transcriptional regulator with XRE-family HTH domain
MPRIAATKGGAEETTRLMVLMAERITQALTRNSELFRAGRGQMADFANRYGIMATTAKRILEGSAFPTHVLLLALSKDCDVPIDWFFGGGHFDIDDEVQQATVNVPIHGLEGSSLGLPRAALRSISEDGEFLAIAIDNNDLHPHVSMGDYGLIAYSETPCLRDPPCAVVYGNNPSAVRLASVTMADPRGESFVISDAHDNVATFRANQVVFGNRKPPKAGAQVLGPLVGRLCLDGFHPIGFQSLVASAKKKTPQPRKKVGGR